MGGSRLPPGVEDAVPTATVTRPLRVLLAEDNAVNQKLMTCLLEKQGHRVTVAANADPHRILPLDAARAFEREGRIGRLHSEYLVTTGNGTGVADAARFGAEWAAELHRAGVQAAVLTST